MLRIGLEANYLYIGRGGVARYWRCLHKALIRHIHEIEQIQPIACPLYHFDTRQPYRAIRTLYREGIWEKLIAHREIERAKIDLFHMTFRYSVQSPRGIPRIATVHDLGYYVNPSRFRRWTLYSGKKDLQELKKMDHVIAVSQATADDCIKYLQISPSKITVIYHGSTFTEIFPSSMKKPEIEIPNDFFLFVSSLEPGKNLSFISKVYEFADLSGCPLPPLLIVGERFHGLPHENSHPSWIYMGRIPDDKLLYLYQKALALIYPSQFEGFGIPILEAMSLGCPVICTPISSLKEVGGSGAYFTPATVSEYAKSMKTFSSSNTTRDEFVKRSLKHASQFTWKKTAEQTLQIYQSFF